MNFYLYCCNSEKIEPLDRVMAIGLLDFRCYLRVATFEFDTSEICHMLVHCFDSFLLLFSDSFLCFKISKNLLLRDKI